MHAVLRPAVRSASKSKSTARARLINGRRYPHPSKPRPFHTSAYRLQTSNPPPNPDDTPAERNVPKSNTQAEKDAVAEPQERTASPEDADAIARKLQHSKELVRRYNSALKRTQRRNRLQDLPPIHIPNWFLENRVLLRETWGLKERSIRRSWNCVVSISDKTSKKQAALTYPFANPKRSTAVLGQICRFMLARRLNKTDAEGLSNCIEGSVDSEPEQGANPEDPTALREGTERFLNDNISPAILAEIRATVAACLASPSAPSGKTNLILHGMASELTNAERYIKTLVNTLAADMDADMIILDAIDLAHIAGDYLGDVGSATSIRSLGYDTYKVQSDLAEDVQDWKDPEQPTYEQEGEETDSAISSPLGFPAFPVAKIVFDVKGSPLLKALGLSGSQGNQTQNVSESSGQYAPTQSTTEIQLENVKVAALLESLIDSVETVRERGISASARGNTAMPLSDDPSASASGKKDPGFFNYSSPNELSGLDYRALLQSKIRSNLDCDFKLGPPSVAPRLPSKPLIIWVEDIKELGATHYGGRILDKLEDIVKRRRTEGQSIMILGTTCSTQFIPEFSPAGIRGLQTEGEVSRTIAVPITSAEVFHNSWSPLKDEKSALSVSLSWYEQAKLRRINLRHIQDMLRSIDPELSGGLEEPEKLMYGDNDAVVDSFPESFTQRVLPYDNVHRIALTAFGLYLQHPSSNHLNWAHVTLAAHLLDVADKVKFDYALRASMMDEPKDLQANELRSKIKGYRGEITKLKSLLEKLTRTSQDIPGEKQEADKTQEKIDQIISEASKYEKGLVRGIINPSKIRTTFEHVHVPPETKEAVRTLTSLSLLRPDAFSYGVLATDKISGVLLYGPPGTGKTLLAKAVAKESGATVLEVSGSEINDKYVGEGEKNVTAIFSLARKLSPCVVFLDEADAIFGSRDGSKHRVSHRDILNQFLKEWDGMNDLSVFIMVATNRPFDLDDAVIRRLPRRLLVDLPTQADRKKILEIHLRDEQLDESVDVDELAKRTPLYSGSDLKNLAVAAALACVREENEQAAIAAVKALSDTPSPPTQEATTSPGVPSQNSETTTTPDASTSSPSPSSGPFPSFPANTILPKFPVPPPSASSSSSAASPIPSPLLTPGIQYTFPPKRTLRKSHFEKALQEISASISEDMTSLNAIKKFDEQFGDRRGRRKRSAYGFGVVPQGLGDERVGRVRV